MPKVESQPLIVFPPRREQPRSFTKGSTRFILPTFPTVGSQLIARSGPARPFQHLPLLYGVGSLIVSLPSPLLLGLLVNEQIAHLYNPENLASDLQIANYGDSSLAIEHEADSILMVENL
jgi:hypothetical protein